jgi:hypothetical protein
MFDTHNAVDEIVLPALLVERHSGPLRHLFVREADGNRRSMGNCSFKTVPRTLKRLNLQGWVSLETIDFSFAADAITNDSPHYLETESGGFNT